MKKNLLLFFLALAALKVNAADYYWVNGGGSWSDLSHWRLGSSSGSIPSIVPSASDNVFFTSSSGFGTTAATRTVTLDANGFCNDMTWDAAVPNNPIFTRGTTSFTVEVWNNLALAASNASYTMGFAFRGTGTSSFATNGTITGPFAFEVNKAGGTLNLADSFVCTSATTVNNIILTAGTFNAANKVIRAYQFNSNNTNTRTLTLTGATLTFSSRWDLRGTNKTLNAANSRIAAGSILAIDGSTYNELSCGGLFDGDMVVSNATISKLTFTNVSAASFATVTNSNTIDTLNFNGRGRIYNSNNIRKVVFANTGNILGSKNTIGTLLAQNKLNISTTDTTTVDSLLLAANQATTLAGIININKYMKAQGATCQAFTEITATDSAKIYFAAGSAALIDNVFLTNIMAYGSITPITVSGVDGGNNPGFSITAPASLTGANLYWIGGAGDWNDNAHWSYTSGGTGGACIPFIYDTVIFNSGSGLTTGNIVTTSGNSYCRNIKWLSGVGTSTFTQAPGTRFYVYGSAVLAPAISVNATPEFVGNDSTGMITFNGSMLGNLNLTMNRPGSGALTFADNWTNATGTISLVNGHLNMPGRTVNIQYLTSNFNTVRYLNITNANIRVANTWAYTGSNNFITDTGSHLISDQYLNITNRYYPNIQLTYGGATDVFNIAQCTIDSLTFTNTSGTSTAKVTNGNTIRRLEFKGAGFITGNNTIDTLILAGSRNYLFGGTNTINKYLQAVSPTCTGLLEMRGNTAGTFVFTGATVINMSNVYLQNMTATGVPPVAVSGADAGGNSGWNISSAAGTPHYWIGGSGDWNDASHWSLSSGGTGGACIPTVNDNVYFDAGSGFTSASKTVTINSGNAYCRNMNWANATNAPIWTKSPSWNMEIWGDSLILNPAATFTALVTAKGPTPAFLKGNVLGDFDFIVDKPGSSLTMLNDFSNAQTNISLYNGTWNVSGRKLNILQVDNSAALANVFTINMNNASIVAPFGWRFQGTIANHTVNGTNSSITTGDFKANGMTYDSVNVTNTLTSSVNMASTTIRTLTFTNTSSSSAVGIVGANNTLGRVEYKGSGVIAGAGNVIDTLIFFPGNTYTFTNGTNTTITKAWYGSGTPCRLTEILSSSTTANATITVTSGDVEFDYVRLRRITAAGAGVIPFRARQHSIDQGGNTNWNIAPYDGAAPIYGLGPDTAIYAADFPYTLYTDGFFGAPSSQYTWNDASTADSLKITGIGTYSVAVNFVDGCTISDTIKVTLRAPLPLSLTGFTAYIKDCQSHLNWTAANAAHFSHFVVERSTDGRSFTGLGQVMYSKNTEAYTYVDKGTQNGTSLYRLKLVDIDGTYQYSPAVSIQSDCNEQGIIVYPTVTNGTVSVNLPAGYDAATIEVFTSAGQLVQLPGSGDVANAGVHHIRFNGLAQGIYWLKLSNKGQVQTFKVFYQP